MAYCIVYPSVLPRCVSARFYMVYGQSAIWNKRWDSELSITNDDVDTAYIRLGRSYSRSHQAKYIHLVS